MGNDLLFPDEESVCLRFLGIFHLTIDEAAIFVAKCLRPEDLMESEHLSFYDKSLNTVVVTPEFTSAVAQFESMIITGIENNKLKAPLIRRNANETIITNTTFVEVSDLSQFLSERNLDIHGDEYEDYAEHEANLMDLALATIRYGVRDRNNDIDPQTKDTILLLENRIKNLEKEIGRAEQSGSPPLEKPLHTKERETLLKLIIGMAIDGYGYDPVASRSPIPRELADALAGRGISIDQDTVRKWLKNASDFMPPEFENPDS